MLSCFAKYLRNKEYQTAYGYLAATISSALYGSIATLAKPTITSVDPILLASLVSLIAAVFLWPIKPNNFSKIRPKNFGMIIIISILGAVLAPSFYFLGLEHTSASNATILANSEITFTVLLAVIFFKEKIGKYGILSFVLVTIGVFFITTEFDYSVLLEINNIGNILILATMACWALDNNISKIITKDVDVSTIVKLKCVIGGIILLIVAVLAGSPMEITSDKITNVLLLATVGFATPLFFFYHAIKRIGAVKTILIFSTSSIFGVIYASSFLNEDVSEIQIIAMAIMLFGILCLYKEKKKHQEKSNLREHNF